MVRKRNVLNAIGFARKPKVFKKLLLVLFGCIFFLFVFVVSVIGTTPKEPFIGIAVLGDPVVIIYIDRTTNHTSLISLPSSTYVDTSASYGLYPVSSLWRLGKIEKKEGQIFASSLGSALAIPVKYYIGLQDGTEPKISVQEHLGHMFTVFAIPQILTKNIETNLSIASYLEVSQDVKNALVTSSILDLTKTFAVSRAKIVDGTDVNKINPDGADLVFRQTHELNILRQENIRVSVINTTGVLGLGQKVARMLSHTGIAVIEIGSEDKQFESCEVTAEKSVMNSQTVKAIASFLSCDVRIGDDTGKADIIVRIGKKEVQKY